MHNKSRGILSMLESYIDMLLNLFAYLSGYVFVLFFFDEQKVQLYHPVTVVVLFVNVLVASGVYHAFGMYLQDRYVKTFHSFPVVFEANCISFGAMALFVALFSRSENRHFILLWVLFAAVASTAMLAFKRHAIKSALRILRKRQYHLRKVIIIGDNTRTAAEYVKTINENEQFGVMIIGYVGDKIDQDEVGVDKLGSFHDLDNILTQHKPTDVVFAIDSYDKRRLIKLVNMCDDKCIKVFFLPVIYGFFKSHRQIEQVGAIPLINIHSTPLDNTANAVLKRVIDIFGSLALIVLTSPIMLIAAIGVRLSSPGPILFKQKRVGVLGKKFTMLKFRSMYVNRDEKNGWTTGDDPRKTRFGTFIRRTAIDELPQLFNVLVGSMSLVGPRPEIPYYVEQFKETVPLYMVKHYVKPGVTGLAQIKGFRGDTSIEARIHEDINYIENWSLMLDIYILLKTPFKAINKSERYVKHVQAAAPCNENAEIASAPEAAEPHTAADAGELTDGAPSGAVSMQTEAAANDKTDKDTDNE